MPADAPVAASEVENASTIAYFPRRQDGGAAAPATPGVRASVRATVWVSAGEACPWISTSNGLSTPAEMPARSSALSPANASPFPGRSFACASAAFSCTPPAIRSATITRPIPPMTSGRRMTR